MFYSLIQKNFIVFILHQQPDEKAWRNILTKPLMKADRPLASLLGLNANSVGYEISHWKQIIFKFGIKNGQAFTKLK